MKASAPSSSVEDYVKVIYSFTEWQDKPITSSQLAGRLGVANSSVSEMVRKLKSQGLVDHQPYSAIALTPTGRTLAVAMVRRHRLLETYLAQELGYSWDEVHEEAEQLEHAVSDAFIDRMAAKLGHPTRDPHGDPIPSADGTVSLPSAVRMSELEPGSSGMVARISDDNPDLLRYLSDEGVALDVQLSVLARRPFGGALVVRIGASQDAHQADFSDEVAASLWLRPPGNAESPSSPTA